VKLFVRHDGNATGEWQTTKLRSIKPFIIGVERRNWDVEDSELSDGAMPAAGLDVNRRHWFERDELAVEFDVAFPFKHDIDFDHLLVEMRAGILVDIHQMNAGCRLGRVCESSARKTAGAFLRCDFVQLGKEVIGHKGKVCR